MDMLYKTHFTEYEFTMAFPHTIVPYIMNEKYIKSELWKQLKSHQFTLLLLNNNGVFIDQICNKPSILWYFWLQ
jgi:hypothetical protein